MEAIIFVRTRAQRSSALLALDSWLYGMPVVSESAGEGRSLGCIVSYGRLLVPRSPGREANLRTNERSARHLSQVELFCLIWRESQLWHLFPFLSLTGSCH